MLTLNQSKNKSHKLVNRVCNSKTKPIFLFLLFLALFSVYAKFPTFIDEYDNVLGGQSIFNGRLPYKDFFSQHTPVAYYISSLGHILGASNVITQRLFVYGLISLFLVILYLRNKNTFGELPLVFVGIFYISSHAANPDLAYAFLSDQIQAIAYLFLFFEFVSFAINRKASLLRWWIVSISSFIAIGVAFVSVYFVFATVMALFILEIQQSVIQNGFVFINELKLSASKIGILIFPFLLALLFLVVSGTLNVFIEQAYILNRDYYSKYIGGFGSSPLQAAISPFVDFPTHLTGLFGQLFTGGTGLEMSNSIHGLLNICVLVVFAFLLGNKNKLAAFFLIMIFAYSWMRGWQGFHAQPYWAVVSASLALALWAKPKSGLNVFGKSKFSFLGLLIGILISVFWVLPFIIAAFSPLPQGSLSFSKQLVGTKETLITSILEPGEGYLDTSLDLAPYIDTNRLPTGGIGGVVPWFTDMLENEFVERIESEKPKIIFHDPEGEVWGYKLSTYAPKLNSYIIDHYTRLNLSEGDFAQGLWIRNEYINKVEKIVENLFPASKYRLISSTDMLDSKPTGVILQNGPISQKFMLEAGNLAALQVKLSTYNRDNSCEITLQVIEEATNLQRIKSLPCSNIKDNSMLLFEFSPIQISKPTNFELVILSSSSKDSDGLTAWETLEPIQGFGEAKIGANVIVGDLVINLLGTKQ